jgi:hypothetical protein
MDIAVVAMADPCVEVPAPPDGPLQRCIDKYRNSRRRRSRKLERFVLRIGGRIAGNST